MAFVDTEVRPAGEVQQKVGRIKLSEAIRAGAKMSRPTKDLDVKAWVTWRGDKCFSCVIGAAWIGINGVSMRRYSNECDVVRAVLMETGATRQIYEEAQHRYEHQDQSREQVADWLAAQGL